MDRISILDSSSAARPWKDLKPSFANLGLFLVRVSGGSALLSMGVVLPWVVLRLVCSRCLFSW
jgi:hypothetical protein